MHVKEERLAYLESLKQGREARQAKETSIREGAQMEIKCSNILFYVFVRGKESLSIHSKYC